MSRVNISNIHPDTAQRGLDGICRGSETKHEFYLNAMIDILNQARSAGVELSVERVPRDPANPRMGDVVYKIDTWDSRKPS